MLRGVGENRTRGVQGEGSGSDHFTTGTLPLTGLGAPVGAGGLSTWRHKCSDKDEDGKIVEDLRMKVSPG